MEQTLAIKYQGLLAIKCKIVLHLKLVLSQITNPKHFQKVAGGNWQGRKTKMFIQMASDKNCADPTPSC